MKDGEEQRDLEESQANQIEISFSSEMQELSPLIQALNCSVNGEEASESILDGVLSFLGKESKALSKWAH